MNNDQFRRILLDTPTGRDGAAPESTPATTEGAVGGKRAAFMPMTPRNVRGGANIDFARQVRERNAAFQPAKKFKSSAPKGVKLGQGYTDRAKARAEASEDADEDDRAKRVKALEDQMKLGQISAETFAALRDEIVGGDVGSTHLVKGLDRRLLDRVRRGEDVLGSGSGNAEDASAPDVDDELDRLGEQDVEVVQKARVEKKGVMAPPPIAGAKRSRDEIMAELKAQRQAAAQAKAAASLDGRWRKVGQKETNRIEIDHKGRQVLITVDEDGMVKRKVRKTAVPVEDDEAAFTPVLDPSKPVLGADVGLPEKEHAPLEKDDDDDIFAGVGIEYNPLGNDDDDDDDDDDEDDSSDEDDGRKTLKTADGSKAMAAGTKAATVSEQMQPAAGNRATEDQPPARPRNYFNDSSANEGAPGQDRLAGVQDLLKKAARMDSRESGAELDEADEDGAASKAKLQRRAAMLAQDDRDLDDMDMGFGGSRFEDVEDEGDSKVRLSEWKGSGNAGDADEPERSRKSGGDKKQRRPKKRKGDANSAADIMRVIEGRKAASGK